MSYTAAYVAAVRDMEDSSQKTVSAKIKNFTMIKCESVSELAKIVEYNSINISDVVLKYQTQFLNSKLMFRCL